MSNPAGLTDLTMPEKIERLFDLRISSSGAQITMQLGNERMNVDYEAWLKLRDSIEQLIVAECRKAEQKPVGDAIEIDVPLETMQFALSKVRAQPKTIARRLLIPEWQVNKWLDGTADKYDLNIYIWRLKVLASLTRRYNWMLFLMRPENLPK